MASLKQTIAAHAAPGEAVDARAAARLRPGAPSAQGGPAVRGASSGERGSIAAAAVGLAGAEAPPVIGVLAVQGAFIEHERMLERLGARCKELRNASDIAGIDGIVLPGGESTVQAKLVRELGMEAPLREAIASGTPVLATCAGMVLLAREVAQGGGSGSASHCDGYGLGIVPMKVVRNAYGRQLGSFRTVSRLEGAGDVPMTFIRAPFVEAVGEGVDVLARVQGRIVAVRAGAVLALSFHPELDESPAVHAMFLDMVRRRAS